MSAGQKALFAAQQNDTGLLAADILYHTFYAAFKLHDLAVGGMPDAGNGGNTVAHPQDLAHLVVLAVKGSRVYFGAQQVNDLAGIGKHLGRLG